jgi:hypothetical protein
MENKWYIGKPIVAIKNSKDNVIKKGQEFTIKGVMDSFCGCKDGIIDVGIKANMGTSRCVRCNKTFPNNYILWKTERLFAPLDQDISELTDILKEPIKEFIEK